MWQAKSVRPLAELSGRTQISWSQLQACVHHHHPKPLFCPLCPSFPPEMQVCQILATLRHSVARAQQPRGADPWFLKEGSIHGRLWGVLSPVWGWVAVPTLARSSCLAGWLSRGFLGTGIPPWLPQTGRAALAARSGLLGSPVFVTQSGRWGRPGTPPHSWELFKVTAPSGKLL